MCRSFHSTQMDGVDNTKNTPNLRHHTTSHWPVHSIKLMIKDRRIVRPQTLPPSSVSSLHQPLFIPPSYLLSILPQKDSVDNRRNKPNLHYTTSHTGQWGGVNCGRSQVQRGFKSFCNIEACNIEGLQYRHDTSLIESNVRYNTTI